MTEEIKTYEETKAYALNVLHDTMMKYAKSDFALANSQYIKAIRGVLDCLDQLEALNMFGLAPKMKP